ncbi:hypothetical protein JL722_7581 [Aureococcus anophagefferens]|nr:hypothetical protein JL722_7581 [Aureococcus anophagefferens]
MASWAKYSVLSSLVTSAVVYYAFATREQFYPTVVYLVTSKVCVLCLGNQAIVFTLLVGRISKQLFLGSLREIEVELLYENSRYAITETRVAPRRPRAKPRGTPPPKPRCLALTIFREELTTRVFALFTALLFAKVFHWLVQSRVEHVEHAERVSTLSHYRLGALMLWLYVLDGAALSMCAILCIRNGPSVLLLFGFEFAILAVSLCAAASRYGLFAVEQRLYEGQWTAKGSYVFAVDFVAEVLRFAFYVVFFTIVFTYYGVPLHIVRELWVSYVSLRRRLAAYKRYRALTANMDERFPSATDEELDACGRICIICRDGMDEGKKLPCGHIFHFGDADAAPPAADDDDGDPVDVDEPWEDVVRATMRRLREDREAAPAARTRRPPRRRRLRARGRGPGGAPRGAGGADAPPPGAVIWTVTGADGAKIYAARDAAAAPLRRRDRRSRAHGRGPGARRKLAAVQRDVAALRADADARRAAA